MAEYVPEGVTSVEGEVAAGELDALLVAFRGYEAALMANDVAALDAAFAPGPATLRGDASGLLVGHERIAAFRALRGGLPPRRIGDVHVRVLSPTAALVLSVSEPLKGGSGLQTQLWEKRPSSDAPSSGSAHGAAWVITAAHVAAPAPAIDSAVWRVVGAPLVPPLPDPSASAVPTATGAPAARPLDGVGVAVKDLFAVGGFAVGGGVPAYLAEAPVAASDADAVAALRLAGASVQGIAQTDEFAYSIAGRNGSYGTPPNAAVPGAIPGGSSSGPASAVALGQVALGLGTDTGGSIRVPASYQGLWGLRTTHGSVSARGLLPLAPSFDTVGWLTRSPELLRAAALATFTHAPGPTAVDLDASPIAARFAVDRRLVGVCAPEVQEVFAALVAHSAFGEVESVELGDIDAVFAAFRVVQGAEAWRAHGPWITAHPGVLAPDVAGRFEIASQITAAAEAEARAHLAEARTRFDDALAGRVLLLPSASSAAPALNASAEAIDTVRGATLRLTSIAGTGGYPAVSVPLMSVPSGTPSAPGPHAPLGLCLVGPRGSDLPLLDLAASLATSVMP